LFYTYTGIFGSEIIKGGLFVLITTVAEKNKRLAASAAKMAKSS
jgi:hypothetical protein